MHLPLNFTFYVATGASLHCSASYIFHRFFITAGQAHPYHWIIHRIDRADHRISASAACILVEGECRLLFWIKKSPRGQEGSTEVLLHVKEVSCLQSLKDRFYKLTWLTKLWLYWTKHTHFLLSYMPIFNNTHWAFNGINKHFPAQVLVPTTKKCDCCTT